MNDKIIYHICTVHDWITQEGTNEYLHQSLESEGFIHCSFKHQINGVLERYFREQTDLMLLIIDSEKLINDLKVEEAPIGESFPHIYGPINKNAIIEVKEWVK